MNGNLGRQTRCRQMRERRDKRWEEREKEESDERDMGGEVGNVCKQFSALLCNLEVAVLGLDAALQGLSASTNASTK